jgi:AraC-like DNA-binding protein
MGTRGMDSRWGQSLEREGGRRLEAVEGFAFEGISTALCRKLVEGVSPKGEFLGWVIEQPYPEPMNWALHQWFQVIVVLSGGQERKSEDWSAAMGPGDMCLTPGWEAHGWQSKDPDTSELVLFFAPSFLGEEMIDDMSWLSLFSRPPHERPGMVPANRQHLLAISEEIIAEMTEKRPGWGSMVRLDTLRLLVTATRGWRPPMGGVHRHVNVGSLARLAPAIALAHESTEKWVGLEEASDACSLSKRRFSAVFRQLMGQSFGQFVLRARLARATELLVGDDLTIAAIAERFGFASASHFHHSFVKILGQTPGQYRRRMQGALGP